MKKFAKILWRDPEGKTIAAYNVWVDVSDDGLAIFKKNRIPSISVAWSDFCEGWVTK